MGLQSCKFAPGRQSRHGARLDSHPPTPTTMRSARFQTLVAQQPDNELFRFSLAQALIDEGKPADAIPHLELCAAKKADWMVARILLGKSLLALGRRDDARRWLENALQLAVEQHHEDPEIELRALLADLA